MAGFLSPLSSLGAHQFTISGGCYCGGHCCWLWHCLFTDMAVCVPLITFNPLIIGSGGGLDVFLFSTTSLPFTQYEFYFIRLYHPLPLVLYHPVTSWNWLEKISFHSNPKERQCQRMFNLSHDCTHLTHYQSTAQNSPSQASTVHELWTSRCSSWI